MGLNASLIKVNSDPRHDEVVIELDNGCTLCHEDGVAVSLPYKTACRLIQDPVALEEFVDEHDEIAMGDVEQKACRLYEGQINFSPPPPKRTRKRAAERAAERFAEETAGGGAADTAQPGPPATPPRPRTKRAPAPAKPAGVGKATGGKTPPAK